MATSKKVKELTPVIKSEDLALKVGVVEMGNIGQTSAVITDEVKLVEMPKSEIEKLFNTGVIEVKTPEIEKTEEEKILDYVANSNLEKVDLTPLIKSLYPMVTFSEPAKYLQHQESKRLKLLFSKMVQDGSVKLESELYTRLGSPYWIEGDTKTKHHTIESTKIVAVK